MDARTSFRLERPEAQFLDTVALEGGACVNTLDDVNSQFENEPTINGF